MNTEEVWNKKKKTDSGFKKEEALFFSLTVTVICCAPFYVTAARRNSSVVLTEHSLSQKETEHLYSPEHLYLFTQVNNRLDRTFIHHISHHTHHLCAYTSYENHHISAPVY